MSRRILTRVGAAAGAAAVLALAGAGPVAAQDAAVPEPDRFTSAFTVMATPEAVVNADGIPTPGTPGATGTFDLRINSDEEVVCYDITVAGIELPYQSPARTATHVHAAPEGRSGPPRLAFPDPTDDDGDGTFTSTGCMQGPFTTGIVPDGSDADTGEGFSLAEIEADPASFSADTHTAASVAGAVRGQLRPMPLGGVDTGAGGTAATQGRGGLVALSGLGLGLGVAAGALVVRRRDGGRHEASAVA